jgi:hypothetical protein
MVGGAFLCARLRFAGLASCIQKVPCWPVLVVVVFLVALTALRAVAGRVGARAVPRRSPVLDFRMRRRYAHAQGGIFGEGEGPCLAEDKGPRATAGSTK